MKLRAQKPHLVKIAGRDVESYGLKPGYLKDISHLAITVKWSVFIALLFGLFLITNVIFACLYLFGDRPIANSGDNFIEYFYFSIETLTTVGYGDMHPQTHYGHIIASIELFTGTLSTAVVTGLIFYRFSLPRARILFADLATIQMHDGLPHLHVRAANERQNSVSNATAKMWLTQQGMTQEGKSYRQFIELPLVRPQSPLFVLSWTIMHLIDEKSPLFNVDMAALEAKDAAIMVMIDGFDEATSQTARARTTYMMPQIRIGERYVDILESSGSERMRINYAKFHLTEKE